MKAPDIKMNGDREDNGLEGQKKQGAKETIADFPINEKLLLDEVSPNGQTGYEHIQLEADESQQHPETRNGENVPEETQLDEVVKK